MERLLPWFRLKSVPGIGNLLFSRLMAAFGSPEAVFNASNQALLAVAGMTPRLAAALHGHPCPAAARREIQRVQANSYRIVTQADDDYPTLLGHIPDPPPFLYVCGRLLKTSRTVAMVGSRHATDYGLKTAHKLAADLADQGFTVVSGMARGIDTAAHRGALGAGGRTVAVLGSGLKRIYPSENINLFKKISKNGAVITEFSLDTAPEAHNFPMRNRIISGLCLGTVVVEASRQSGSLITARLAADQGREVFAVPGSIQSFKSTGTHSLIKTGAKLVEHVQDVVAELIPMLEPETAPAPDAAPPEAAPAAKGPSLPPQEAVIYDALGPYPVHVDELGRATGTPPAKLLSLLLLLELKGLVEKHPGNCFSRVDG